MAKSTTTKKAPAKPDDADAWAPEFKDGQRIHIAVDGNPRAPGSKAALHWRKYKDGMSIAEFRAAGGERGRLRTDLARENLKLR
jgi:hypothetical protein